MLENGEGRPTINVNHSLRVVVIMRWSTLSVKENAKKKFIIIIIQKAEGVFIGGL